MLIRFRLTNYLSFRDEAELSLVATALKDDAADVIQAPGATYALLPAVAIYGANASGKSNLFKGLNFMATAVLASQRTWKVEGPIPRQSFALGSGGADTPSSFEVDLLIDDVRYQYGFTVNDEVVLEEWLYAYPHGRRRLWFLREGSEFSFGKWFFGENRTIEELTRPNSLFLSAAAQSNHELATLVYRWFAERLRSATTADLPARSLFTTDMLEAPETADAIESLLGAADLGVTSVQVRKETSEEEKLRQAVLEAIKDIKGVGLQFDPTSRVSLRHRVGHGAGVDLPFHAESDGTRTLFALAGPIVWALRSGATLLIDDLDSNLHPILACAVVKRFLQGEGNPKGAQLLFNTHDTNLLSGAGLRRDQVWFIEKDQTGGSHLYPLTDYRPRKVENLERGYLQGRYGAVPVPNTSRFLAALAGTDDGST